MTKAPKFTHLFEASSASHYQKAACGAMVKHALGGLLSEAREVAAMRERYGFLPPLCQKCAALALIHETATAANGEGR